ncbi:MAG: alpha/beta hydrolase [Ilumatobacter sp.]|nr:alpha/beta hydrolase [Ilumatobacter sp.]
MAETDRGAAPPSNWLRVLEARAVFELGAAVAAAPWLRMIGRGDNHPVLILPGFLADDSSTLPLRYILRGQGYWVDGWDLGRNLGPTPHIVDGLLAKLHAMHDRHDAPVSLIGWSLGGIYARRIARRHPEMVRQVITLGSPFRITPDDRSAVSRIYERLSPQHIPIVEEALPGIEAGPLTVPATSIYTRTDGVVRWWQCLDDEGPQRENIEVYGSHSGLGFNPAAIYAISDRLAQRPGEWAPFSPPPGTSQFFPKPTNWSPRVAA